MSFLALMSLTACGGGGSNTPCQSTIPGLCSALNPAGSQTSGGTAGGASTTALFTTAPTKITLASGGNATYNIGGGSGLYTATSGNTGVVTATASGTTLTINSIAAGSAQIAVVDSTGKTVTIDVTVLAKGQTGTPPSIFPASITAGVCTTNIPFVFTGGTSPFTVLTSDNSAVPVGPALGFGNDNYFTASIKNLPSPNPTTATVTVLDAQSRTATASILVGGSGPCAKNALLQALPASANARVTEKLTFQITGGIAPYTVTSTNPPGYPTNIATAVMNADGISFDVTANSTGGTMALTGAALITVTSAKGDDQKANIVFTVFPQP